MCTLHMLSSIKQTWPTCRVLMCRRIIIIIICPTGAKHFSLPSSSKEPSAPRGWTVRSEWCAACLRLILPTCPNLLHWYYMSLGTHRHRRTHTRGCPRTHAHSTQIAYVRGQIIRLISDPHNPATSKINQTSQKNSNSDGKIGRESLRWPL